MAKISTSWWIFSFKPILWQDAKVPLSEIFYIASLTCIELFCKQMRIQGLMHFIILVQLVILGLKQGDIQNAPSTADYSRPHMGASLGD